MYNRIIEQFIAAQKAAHAAYAAAAAFERETVAAVPDHYLSVDLRSEYRTERELQSFCRSVAGGVVNRARREFAPAGARLDIDNQDEYERAGLDIGEALKAGKIPDLDGLWTSMARRYGGHGGAELAYQQAAQRIVSGFGLNRKREVQRTASVVVLRKHAISEACYGRSARKVGYYSCQSTADCLSGLATFAAKAGHHMLAGGLNRVNVHQVEYNYREKHSYPGLDIVFFKEAWEFRFSHQVADDLMLFLGEYGEAFMQEAV
ncbi:hypothetical protein QO239_09905 [Cupriavidus taiwanensis]|uniref:hypothetical protein n=1 Tax=Cupriavidus taiwanensis TaxID=164546 RepID=UPI002540399C|nr:hypothetical protein [Cupriavidus taiwanensis]MDK3022904.1 hypothetical protein [Cupriavidus taiwanensis]